MSWFSNILRPHQEHDDQCPLQFDLPGWHRQPRTDANTGAWQWLDGDGDSLTVRVEEAPAFADGDARDLKRLRAVCRERARRENASIIQVDPAYITSIPGLQVITKARLGLAASYVGRLIFPLAAPHFLVQVEARERGVTGQRDALATAAMASRGELEFEPPESPGGPRRIKGWAVDPYDPAFDRDSLNFVSDDERLDPLVPRHPLSKMRSTLALIRQTTIPEGHVPVTMDSGPSWESFEPRRGRMSSAALGMLCFQAKLFEQSEAAFTESIAAWEASGSAPDPDIASQFLLVGLACERQGKQRDALSAYQRSERAATVSSGPDHLLVAHALNNQGRSLIAMADHAAAEPLLERALTIFESKEGERSSTAVALNGLGMVRNAQTRPHEAIPLFERALRIFEQEHGRQFRDSADVWRNLAMSFAHIGDERNAKHALSRSEAIVKGAK